MVACINVSSVSTSLPPRAAEVLEQAFESDEHLVGLARRILEDFPELGGDRYGDEDIAQILRAFGGLAIESLRGGDGSTREIFLTSAIPAVVAEGETPATLARSATLFGIVMSSEIGGSLEGEDKRAATAWLARFFGEYARDAVDAAMAAQ